LNAKIKLVGTECAKSVWQVKMTIYEQVTNFAFEHIEPIFFTNIQLLGKKEYICEI